MDADFNGLVLLMVPGMAMFYGGLLRAKNVLATMMHSFVAIAIIGVGFALTNKEKLKDWTEHCIARMSMA